MADAHPQKDAVPKRRRGISKLAQAEERTALLLLLPSFVVLLLIAAFPLGQVFYSSFTNARFAAAQHQQQYVGFDNYVRLLTMTIRQVPPVIDPETGQQAVRNGVPQYENPRLFLRRLDSPRTLDAVYTFGLFGNLYVLGATSPQFIRSIWDTLVFTVAAVGLETILGLIIALALSANFFGRGMMRAAMLVPWAIITVVSARIWEWILAPSRIGFANTFLDQIGVGDGNIGFFTNAALQLPSMIAMDVWKTTPFMALLFLAGLATIPTELYEAAEVDGATKIRRFFSITLPLLMPTLAVALIFRTLDSLKVFDIFQVVLGRQRYSMSSYAQDLLINGREAGLSSAASVIIFLLIFGFAILYARALRVDTE